MASSILCSVCDIQNMLVLLNSLGFLHYDDILDTIWIIVKKLLDFKLSISGQILHVHKIGFPGLVTFGERLYYKLLADLNVGNISIQ